MNDIIRYEIIKYLDLKDILNIFRHDEINTSTFWENILKVKYDHISLFPKELFKYLNPDDIEMYPYYNAIRIIFDNNEYLMLHCDNFGGKYMVQSRFKDWRTDIFYEIIEVLFSEFDNLSKKYSDIRANIPDSIIPKNPVYLCNIL